MIQIHAFKKKEKDRGKGRPQLGGPWNVPCLVAFRRKSKSIIFTSFHFLPHKILLKPLFH
jgi:hypothetical protein